MTQQVCQKKKYSTVPVDTRTRSKHGHIFCLMTNNTNEYKCSFFPQTIFQQNCLSKALVDSKVIGLKDWPQLSTLVALATLAFILHQKFLLIIYVRFRALSSAEIIPSKTPPSPPHTHTNHRTECVYTVKSNQIIYFVSCTANLYYCVQCRNKHIITNKLHRESIPEKQSLSCWSPFKVNFF